MRQACAVQRNAGVAVILDQRHAYAGRRPAEGRVDVRVEDEARACGMRALCQNYIAGDY